MACDAQTLINTAYSLGYAKLSERSLMECIVAAACAGGIAGGGGQVLQYVTDPNTEAITPTNINQPAIAYSASGYGSYRQWDTTNHTWSH